MLMTLAEFVDEGRWALRIGLPDERDVSEFFQNLFAGHKP